ncbi:hypothetical protein D3C87_1366770 [compost metagenome]
MKHMLAPIILAVLFPFLSYATTKEEVANKTSEAASAAASYTKEQKEEFTKNMEDNIAKMKTQIADMKKAASKKTGEAKKEMDEQIASLEKEQAELKADLKRLKKSSGKAWDEMKSGMSAAWDKVSESYVKAKSEF